MRTEVWNKKSQLVIEKSSSAFVLNMPKSNMSDEHFFEFCQANNSFRIERNANDQIMIIPPTGGKKGMRNSDLNLEIGIWNKTKKEGKVFDSSTGFKFPNGAVYSPDLSWVLLKRWNALNEEQQEKFISLCPDFVIELRSKTDSLKALSTKMKDYINEGCRLAWMIDPYHETVYIYKKGEKVKEQSFDTPLSGQDVLKELSLDLRTVFD